MHTIDFTTFSLPVNLLILTISGIIVWLAGTKMALMADTISERTSLSRAMAGALLLGVATSLPEIVTTVAASSLGNAPLAVNNLLGGVSMQLVVLAFVDWWFVRGGTLTFFSPNPVLLLGGVLLILHLAVFIVAVAVGDYALPGGIGVWPLVLAGVYVLSLYFMNRFSALDTWSPSRLPEQGEEGPPAPSDAADDEDHRSIVNVVLQFAIAGVVVLLAGWAVSTSADAVSKQSGIGSGFIGATLVAITTSLPEISTAAGAVRLGAYTMAISNIFGTNCLEVALLFPSDLAFRSGPVINAVASDAILLGGVGIVVTTMYLWGLLERRDQAIAGMGVDSWWVVLTYLTGLGLLWQMT
ncbi:sodium:calcium antiporter [Rubinisphaera brasiliensis]|uniref:Sodium/calcium exchanger membrane region n=1 Tax=Rubinisphaera brasiliensis (strain ATCC 49424 / DSM 5305 / JCM 21570 / IAM 15109 / NBRC 103401 / IFAM 1448) TaxID=756272 RepID=F0SLD3_RUBBR|nr:sodium:calcium antiporter [Rubinisphaera brasiliensis]ADY62039.1 sodium/calcium exchanger membrane region [Rubinisphaera brasiliensis DSM 5305]